MAAEQEQAQPTTTQGSGEIQSTFMTVLRWVFPRGAPVTVLADTPVVIGRDPACQVRLDTSRVSRRHAEIKPVEGRASVRDLDSKNGVHLNGKRVSEAALSRGDVLRVGNFIAVVESVTASDLPGFRELGHGIHGGAAVARALHRTLSLAASPEPILFEGELGTGKELLARAVHRASSGGGPFVALRAEDVDAGELEAALAAGGTLYVDGISSLSPEPRQRS
jgi:transcriptional regulator of aromatic amino acid metabolism